MIVTKLLVSDVANYTFYLYFYFQACKKELGGGSILYFIERYMSRVHTIQVIFNGILYCENTVNVTTSHHRLPPKHKSLELLQSCTNQYFLVLAMAQITTYNVTDVTDSNEPTENYNSALQAPSALQNHLVSAHCFLLVQSHHSQTYVQGAVIIPLQTTCPAPNS